MYRPAAATASSAAVLTMRRAAVISSALNACPSRRPITDCKPTLSAKSAVSSTDITPRRASIKSLLENETCLIVSRKFASGGSLVRLIFPARSTSPKSCGAETRSPCSKTVSAAALRCGVASMTTGASGAAAAVRNVIRVGGISGA